MVLLKSPYHLCLVTLLPILLAEPLVMKESKVKMCRLGVEVQLIATLQDVSNQTTKTHATPRCILQAIEWWLYSQVVGVQQQYTMVNTTGRGSSKTLGGGGGGRGREGG